MGETVFREFRQQISLKASTWIFALIRLCLCRWQPTPVFLPGESHGQRSLVGSHPESRELQSQTRPKRKKAHTVWRLRHRYLSLLTCSYTDVMSLLGPRWYRLLPNNLYVDLSLPVSCSPALGFLNLTSLLKFSPCSLPLHSQKMIQVLLSLRKGSIFNKNSLGICYKAGIMLFGEHKD